MQSANELVFIKMPHPASDLYGVADVIAGLAAINGNVSIEDYLSQFFEHNAIPQYMIIITGTDEVDNKVVTKVNKFFKENIKKKHHTTMIFPVPQGVTVEVKALADNAKEGSFQETRKNNRDNILIAHGMTPAQIGIIDVANLGSGSGLSQAENYKDRILKPRQAVFETLFWNRLFGKYGMGLLAVQLEFNCIDIRDEEQIRKNIETYLKLGLITINEAREMIGLEPVEKGGDVLFIVLGNEIKLIEDLEDGNKELKDDILKELKHTFKNIIKE
jgi:capsid portal protein